MTERLEVGFDGVLTAPVALSPVLTALTCKCPPEPLGAPGNRRRGKSMNVTNVTTPPRWQGLEYHPFSELTEFGVGIDTEAVIDHMAHNGWDPSERITLYQGKILDGRHKHSCAQKAEVEPLFQEVSGSDAEALEFVRKKLLRQHLTTDQRAVVAAKLATLTVGANQHAEGPPFGGPSRSRAAVAKQMNVSERSVDRAKALLTKCVPAVQRAYHTGEVSLTDAASVAPLPAARQEKALDDFRTGKVSALAAWVQKDKAKLKAKPKTAAKAELRDRTGRVIPDSCRDAFADPALGDLIHELEQAASFVRADGWAGRAVKLADHYGFLLLEKFHEHAHEALHRLQLAIEALKAGVPYAVCPQCGGTGDGCPACRGRGHVPEHRYQELAREPV
jgi:hypothetical protein